MADAANGGICRSDARAKEQAQVREGEGSEPRRRIGVEGGEAADPPIHPANQRPPAPVSLEPDIPLAVLKEGWLMKQSKRLKTWQKRFCVLDNAALYYCKSPNSTPDGFFVIRKCQFKYSEETSCFDIISSGNVFRVQAPEGAAQLREWAECYKGAMARTEFPYYHVEQTTRLDISRELLLGVMSRGIRLVKLGLYDPGFEEEVAFYLFEDLQSWGASDLGRFEFKVTAERVPYVFETMHAQEIESRLQSNHGRWQEWQLSNQQLRQPRRRAPGRSPLPAEPGPQPGADAQGSPPAEAAEGSAGAAGAGEGGGGGGAGGGGQSVLLSGRASNIRQALQHRQMAEAVGPSPS